MSFRLTSDPQEILRFMDELDSDCSYDSFDGCETGKVAKACTTVSFRIIDDDDECEGVVNVEGGVVDVEGGVADAEGGRVDLEGGVVDLMEEENEEMWVEEDDGEMEVGVAVGKIEGIGGEMEVGVAVGEIEGIGEMEEGVMVVGENVELGMVRDREMGGKWEKMEWRGEW